MSDECVGEKENSLGFYVVNFEENLIKGVAPTETIHTKDNVTSGEFKKQKAQELKQKWCAKKIYEQFVKKMPEKVDQDRTWQWLSKSDLKIGTEALLCVVQEQAIRTNYVKHLMDKTSESPLCRLCGKKG